MTHSILFALYFMSIIDNDGDFLQQYHILAIKGTHIMKSNNHFVKTIGPKLL